MISQRWKAPPKLAPGSLRCSSTLKCRSVPTVSPACSCPPSLLGPCELRIDLRDFENNYYFAKYASFRVLGEAEKYQLVLGDFLGGNAGKLAAAHRERLFLGISEEFDIYSADRCHQTLCTINIWVSYLNLAMAPQVLSNL